MTAPDPGFVARPLVAGDATAILDLLRAQAAEYLRFFYALPRETPALERLLADSRRDIYQGLFEEGRLVGLFMLRGWDAGYEIPSFGILIAGEARGRGYLQLTLAMAAELCREGHAPRFMAKIHPDNLAPRAARRLQLVATGVESGTGNVIYHRTV